VIERERRYRRYGTAFQNVKRVKFENETSLRKPASGRDAEERFRLLVESVTDYAIFVLDASGRVVTWNAGAERIKGYAVGEIIGKHFSVFYPTEDVIAGKCERELEVAAREGRFEDEGWRVRKDGTLFWANVVITALRNPDATLYGFAKVTRDLTERRKAEETQRLLAAERAALAEKTRIQEFQERFIAILGHDLRNPLAAIDMNLARLREKVADPTLVRMLNRMASSSTRMSRMIGQILDLTRSRLAGGLELQPAAMDLHDALTRIVEELRAAHPTRTIDLRSPALPGTWDRDRLEQVFSNLIGNALLYGDPDRPITVEAVDDGATLHVDVHNHGAPIPEAQQADLFNPFRRGGTADDHRKSGEGLGLGLYISRELVAAHGGAIDVRSEPGQGTTFRVTLPRG
jgi:PAS domain S-box-containing protein